MDTDAIRAELSALARDASLLQEMNVGARSEAMDYLVFVEDVAKSRRRIVDLSGLGRQATALRQKLEAVNDSLFARLCERLGSPERTNVSARHVLDRFTDYRPGGPAPHYLGYDGLDVVLDGVLDLDEVITSSRVGGNREMVHLEATPARAILDMVDHACIVASDIFFDLGSGMGQVTVLVHLVTGAPSFGVEVEPDYCRAAERGAARLGLRQVRFVNADAREADLSHGTVFFMFTPFLGGLRRAVMARLANVARHHPIRVCTYGDITLDIAEEPWLRIKDPQRLDAFKLAVFESVRDG